MNPRPRAPIELGAHLSEETLARLAEAGSGEESDARAIRHLSACRSCMAAYSDAVRYHAAWIAAPELFGDAVEVPRARRRHPVGTPLAMAAGVLLVSGLAAMLVWRGSARTTTSAVVPGATVVALLESASATDLVFPGGEAGAARTDAAYRAGSGATDSAQDSLEALRARYEQGPRSADLLYTLAAGLAAAGRNDLSHDYVNEGRALYAPDARFMVLEAILARRHGDAPEAARAMREARLAAPRDVTVLLDEALLLGESGQRAASDALLRDVIRRASRSPLADRARRELGGGASR